MSDAAGDDVMATIDHTVPNHSTSCVNRNHLKSPKENSKMFGRSKIKSSNFLCFRSLTLFHQLFGWAGDHNLASGSKGSDRSNKTHDREQNKN